MTIHFNSITKNVSNTIPYSFQFCQLTCTLYEANFSGDCRHLRDSPIQLQRRSAAHPSSQLNSYQLSCVLTIIVLRTIRGGEFLKKLSFYFPVSEQTPSTTQLADLSWRIETQRHPLTYRQRWASIFASFLSIGSIVVPPLIARCNDKANRLPK